MSDQVIIYLVLVVISYTVGYGVRDTARARSAWFHRRAIRRLRAADYKGARL